MRNNVRVTFGDNPSEAFRFMDFFFDRLVEVEFRSADDAVRDSSLTPGQRVRAGWTVTLERPAPSTFAVPPTAGQQTSILPTIRTEPNNTDTANWDLDPSEMAARFAERDMMSNATGATTARGFPTRA